MTHDDACCADAAVHALRLGLRPAVALANGSTMFLEEEISPKRIGKLLREHDVDFFAGTPAMYGSLVRCRR